MKGKWLKSEKTYYIIFGLILTSIFLYTYIPKIENTIVYNPEKLHYSSQNFKDLFINSVFYDNIDSARPPLTFFILHPINRYFENYDLVSKKIFFIFALMSVLTIFFVASKIFNKEIGILSSLLMMSNYYFSLMVGTIEDLFLFVTISIWNFYFFNKGIINKEKKYLWGWIITNILLVWTYYAFIYIFIAQFIFILINRKKVQKYLIRKSNIKYLITFIITTLPIFINMINSFATPYPEMEGFINERLLFSFITNSINTNSIFSLILFTIISLIGVYYFFNNIKKLKHQYLALILIPFIFTLPYIERTTIYVPKYSFGFLWIVFIIISLSLNQIKKVIKSSIKIEKKKEKKKSILKKRLSKILQKAKKKEILKVKIEYIISLLIILLSITTLSYNRNYDKTDTPLVSEYLKTNSKNISVYSNYQFYSEYFMYDFSKNKTEYFRFRNKCFSVKFHKEIIKCNYEDYNLINTNKYTISDLKKFLNYIEKQNQNEFYYVDGNYLPREKHEFELDFIEENCSRINLNYEYKDVFLYKCKPIK